MYCISKYILDIRCFDAAEPDNPQWMGYIQDDGNNIYKPSNIRQWLNSNAPAGEWYTPQHNADVAPNYQNRPGFLYHWSDKEKELLQNVENTLGVYREGLIESAGGDYPNCYDSYIITDKIWLPTITQLTGEINKPISIYTTYMSALYEGFHFSYFDSNDKRKAYLHPNVYENTSSTKKPSSVNDAWYYWLSSPNINPTTINVPPLITTTSIAPLVDPSGDYIYTYSVWRGYIGFRPCIKLLNSATVEVK